MRMRVGVRWRRSVSGVSARSAGQASDGGVGPGAPDVVDPDRVCSQRWNPAALAWTPFSVSAISRASGSTASSSCANASSSAAAMSRPSRNAASATAAQPWRVEAASASRSSGSPGVTP